jgi:hypothetical protein
MNLKDIKAAISFDDLWVTPTFASEIIDSGIGKLKPTDSENEYDLIVNEKFLKVSLRDISKAGDLNFHLKRGCAHLAEVVQVAKDGKALKALCLKVIFFNGEIIEMGDVEVGIDGRIETTAKRNGIRFNDTESLGINFAKKCTISSGSDTYFLMMCGAAADEDFEKEELNDSSSGDAKTVPPDKEYREFSIYGERLRIPVEKRNIEKSKEIYFATKIIFNDSQKSEGSLRLARGQITFSNWTKIGGIRALAAGAMSQLTKEDGSYMKQWDEYGAIEGEMLLTKAKSVGRINYQKAEKTVKGVKFFIHSTIPDNLTEDDEIELTTEEPLYIKNPDINWEQYSRSIEEEYKSKTTRAPSTEKNTNESVIARIINISERSIELELPKIPSEGMFLILSINGDKTQIERKMKARNAIIEGRSANPLLGLLIEEDGVIPDIQRVTKLKPLTPFVKEKIFKHQQPTDRQREAIEIALNTPDIALIQGPPGTGKTTVITAILERLNEEYDKTKSIHGQILVSGFQHDAVENIISRLSVNALPVVKFGKRKSDSEYSEDAVTEKMDMWCSNIAKNIRNKNPEIAHTEDQIRLRELFGAYSLCPSLNNAHNLLKRILDLPRKILADNLVAQTKGILDLIQPETNLLDPSKIRVIRSLRISEKAFMDDGPARAMELRVMLENVLSEEYIEILDRAAQWKTGNNLDFLKNLKILKGNLLLQYLPRPDFRVDKPRKDILELVGKVSTQLEKAQSTNNKRNAVLAEFLHELDDNSDGVLEAIEDYNFIFAATTQQSEGRDIRRAKKKFKKDEFVTYDTVIIDEAARVSPRDLMIPMAQAEKRIILVGDHRIL